MPRMVPRIWSSAQQALIVCLAMALPSSAEISGGAELDLLTALRMTLQRDPNISLQETQVQAARGSLLIASGKFDPLFASTAAASDLKVPLSAASDLKVLEQTLDYQQLFRGGLAIEPSVDITRTDSGAPPPFSVGTLSFKVRQPLLRGRGRVAAAGAELAAAREVEAAMLDLRFTMAQRIQAVANQYWTAAAAGESLAILRGSEQEARNLLATTEKLVAGDVTPAAELVQVQADLAAKEAQRIGGELALLEARESLARAIGLDYQAAQDLPMPRQTFPALTAAAAAASNLEQRFVDLAMKRRADLRAARVREQGAEVLLESASANLKPQLDLLAGTSYDGGSAGSRLASFLSSLYAHSPGISWSAGISLSLPIHNDLARGGVELAAAGRRQRQLQVTAVANSIGTEVPAALGAVSQVAAQLEKDSQSVRLFERAVDNQQRKLGAGTSTLIDVIIQRDRLTGARQSLLADRLALASALLRLRFATGSLLAADGDAAQLAAAQLMSIPFEEAAAP